MCGRATHRLSWAEIHALYRLIAPAAAPNLEPHYNVCPTDTIPVVIERDGGRALVPMRWGLVPAWWKKSLKELPATFNARAESVAEKPMFRDAFKRRRCLVPISGYYEWVTAPDGKQPFYFTRRDGAPITVAGLWDEWRNGETGEPLQSCTMIITAANDFTRAVHDRMPVLLEPDSFAPWLGGGAGTELLRPAANDVLRMWPVSRRVNSSRAPCDDPTLIEPAEPLVRPEAAPHLVRDLFEGNGRRLGD
jgi:putative SOS response-associated peptidase YedK